MVKTRLPFVSAIVTIFITACGSQLQYSSAEVARIRSTRQLEQLEFITNAGKQKALYYSVTSGIPQKLVIIFPGIKSRALDWLDFAQNYPGDDVGFLMLDFPGRGESEGSLRPSRVWQSAEGALSTLEDELGADHGAFDDRLILIGHSFGTGAAMQFSLRKTPQQVILMAPFTKLRKLMVKRFGLLGWIIPNGLNNDEMISELLAEHPEIPITIFHGDKDRSIPVTMSRELSKLDGVTYHEVKNGDHVDILTTRRPELFRLIKGN